MPLVVLDPGHGGTDPGAQGNGLLEKDLALTIARQVRDFLIRHYAVTVRMTRDSDVFVPLAERADFANRLGTNYFVSLHHNAAGGEGFESYVYPGTRDEPTGRMQNVLHDEIMSYLSPLGVKDRGKKEANFAVLRETTMPAILLENLFVDNEFDANLLKNQQVLQELSRRIADGIGKAMNLAPVAPSPSPSAPPPSADWKLEAVNWLFEQGLLTNKDWRNNVEAPLPLWAQAVVLRRMYEQLKGK